MQPRCSNSDNVLSFPERFFGLLCGLWTRALPLTSVCHTLWSSHLADLPPFSEGMLLAIWHHADLTDGFTNG